MKDEVVVTGSALVCSLGLNTEEVWNALLAGKSGIRPISGFDAENFGCRTAAQVQGLNPAKLGISPRASRIMDLHSYLLMKCARDARLESKLDKTPVAGEDIGFFVGMGTADYNIGHLLPSVLKARDAEGKLSHDRFFREGYREIYPLWPLSMLNNIAFCQVAIDLGIRGENAVFSHDADAGVQAIAEGVQAIREQKAEVVFVGGVSEKICPESLVRARLSKILNTSDDMMCRPFSKNRKGTVLGEGCGVLVLEKRSHAADRGAPFMAAISGYGFACGTDGHDLGPETRAIARAMNNAMLRAGIGPLDIDLVIAHGDGSLAGDRNEMEAIHRVFWQNRSQVKVFSSKGALGNSLAASAVSDAVLALSMFRNRIVPPTIFSDPEESEIRFEIVKQVLPYASLKRILINGRSHEGQCASLVIESCR